MSLKDAGLFQLETVIRFLISRYHLNKQQKVFLREFISGANLNIHTSDVDFLYAETICQIDSEGKAVIQFSANLRLAMQTYLNWRNRAFARLIDLEKSSGNQSVLSVTNLILLVSMIFWLDRQEEAISKGGQLLEDGEIFFKN